MFMLAHRYFPDLDPTGWLVSEKYDGWRALWNGSAFVSRDGNPLPAPASWIQSMPAGVALDGELYLGRGRFRHMQRAVRSSDWSALRFMVFDAPQLNLPVENRLQSLSAHVLPGFCSVVEQSRCSGRADLHSRFADVVSAGGEGLMLRAPGSFYVPARSPRLLKLKPHGID
jgi:DNA ligase-1